MQSQLYMVISTKNNTMVLTKKKTGNTYRCEFINTLHIMYSYVIFPFFDFATQLMNINYFLETFQN